MIYQCDALCVQLLNDEIAELCFANQGSVNTLDSTTLQSLEQAIATLEQNPNIKGLMITSNKDAFIVGADITEFLEMFALPDAALEDYLIQANRIFNRIEDLPYPTVSVIRGYALGGGCECALATDFRIADNSAQLGLPETTLGIMPGFGGTVRLPRLIGADNALEWITTGKNYQASACLALGVVDAIVDTNQLTTSAHQLLMDAIAGKIDWQTNRHRKTSPLTLNKQEAAMSFTTAKGMVAAKAGPHYPAPLLAVDTITSTATMSRDKALHIEQKNFVTLAKTSVAHALVGLFLNDHLLKGKAKQATRTAQPITSAAVLGAGIMGGGIAYQSASKGISTVIKDINEQALTLGMEEAAKLLTQQQARGRLTVSELTKTLSRIKPTLYYEGLQDLDAIIEAVVENADIKAQVLKEVEAIVTKNTVIASNTSTLPISSLAAHLKYPERFCGMHFFNPVHRMPLVEVIRGEHTSDETINRVMAYASAMGKTPVVVNDCPGFFVNRVLFPYFFGFNLLLADGVDFSQIDKIMERNFGWPMGPAYLLDVVGTDTAHHAATVMAKGFPERMGKGKKSALDLLYEQQRFGQKNGHGFYEYTTDKKGKPQKNIDDKIYPLLTKIAEQNQTLDTDDIIARMMIPLINEVVLCLEEGIIGSAAEADMALIYGIGFPPFHGGPLRYLDTIGLTNYIALADRFAYLGPLYQVSDQLRAQAAQGKRFY